MGPESVPGRGRAVRRCRQRAVCHPDGSDGGLDEQRPQRGDGGPVRLGNGCGARVDDDHGRDRGQERYLGYRGNDGIPGLSEREPFSRQCERGELGDAQSVAHRRDRGHPCAEENHLDEQRHFGGESDQRRQRGRCNGQKRRDKGHRRRYGDDHRHGRRRQWDGFNEGEAVKLVR